jgi:hypothetical protein
MPPLHEIFDAAKRFGLTEREAWETVEESLDETYGEDAMSEFHEELTAALAARILAKQRASLPSQSAGTAKAR